MNATFSPQSLATMSVMETGTNNYRLERWIAVLLSLLFLLPFVTRG